jgi:Kef-type K+ transport system membrane component KefB
MVALLTSYFFPNNLYSNETQKYNFWVQAFGTIFFGLVIMLIPYIIAIIIKKDLKNKKFMIAYSICFGIACLLMIYGAIK